MRFLCFALLLVGCSEYEYYGEGGQSAFPFEDGPNIAFDDDVAFAEVYAHTSTSLYSVDPITGATEFQGNFHNDTEAIEGFVDIAIDMDGRLWGGTFDRLYTIEPRTGFVRPICSLDFAPFAMTFGPNGVLYAGASDQLLFEVDKVTCAKTVLVDDPTYTTSGDIVGLPDGFLYWTVEATGANGNNRNDELVRIDPANGSTEWMGVIDAESLYGVGYSDGTLYGFSSDGLTVAIDPSNGSSTDVDQTAALSWWGATTNPVRW